jgi:hypothetical protein
MTKRTTCCNWQIAALARLLNGFPQRFSEPIFRAQGDLTWRLAAGGWRLAAGSWQYQFARTDMTAKATSSVA